MGQRRRARVQRCVSIQQVLTAALVTAHSPSPHPLPLVTKPRHWLPCRSAASPRLLPHFQASRARLRPRRAVPARARGRDQLPAGRLRQRRGAAAAAGPRQALRGAGHPTHHGHAGVSGAPVLLRVGVACWGKQCMQASRPGTTWVMARVQTAVRRRDPHAACLVPEHASLHW